MKTCSARTFDVELDLRVLFRNFFGLWDQITVCVGLLTNVSAYELNQNDIIVGDVLEVIRVIRNINIDAGHKRLHCK